MERDLTTAIFSIFGSKLVLTLSGVVVTPVLVRLLGPNQYGEYAFLLSVVAITVVVVKFGAFKGTRKFIVEDRDIYDWKNMVLGFNIRLVLINSTIVCGLLIALTVRGGTSPIFGRVLPKYTLLLSGIILLRSVFAVVRSGLMGYGLESRSEPLLVTRKIIFGVSAVTLAYYKYGVAGVLFGEFLGLLVVTVVAQLFYSERVNISNVFKGFTELPRRSIFKYNMKTMLLALFLISLYNTDIILVRYYTGMTETGLYKAALTIAEFLWFAPMAVQIALLHSSSELWGQGETNNLSKLSSRAARYTFLFTALLILGLAALATPFVIFYYGEPFRAATEPLLLLLPGVLGFAIARPIFAVSQGQQNLRTLVVATAVASMVNVLLNILLIPKFGINGAAIATSVGYGSMLFLHIWVACRLGFNPMKDLRANRIVATVVVSAPVIFGLSGIISSPILSLLVVPPTGLLVFTGLAVKIGAIDMKELNILINRFKNIM